MQGYLRPRPYPQSGRGDKRRPAISTGRWVLPRKRESDGRTRGNGYHATVDGPGDPPRRCVLAVTEPRQTPGVAPASIGRRRTVESVRGGGDRKSTRLNSSH